MSVRVKGPDSSRTGSGSDPANPIADPHSPNRPREMITLSRPMLLQLQGIHKRFGAMEVLRGVDFEVDSGEVVALVGDNGAGKSTLIKAIAGVHQADSGRYIFEGSDVEVTEPRDALRLGIVTVFQDLALCENLDVVGNLFLGHEKANGRLPYHLQFLDEPTMEQRTDELLHQLRIQLPSVRHPVATLSGGQRQSIAIARAVLRNSRLIILDEPTAALGVAQTHEILQLICQLRERGLGIVIVSHSLSDVFEVANRIVVLRLGRRIATFDRSCATREQVLAAITGVAHPGS